MDTFFNILRKSLVATMVMVFAFVVVYVPQNYNQRNTTTVATFSTVTTANAFFVDIPNLIQNTFQAIKSAALWLKEFALDGIAWAIAKRIVSNMVSSLITWINSGFKGRPAFIEDLGGFLLEAADQAAGQYIDELGGIGSFICSPFRLDIQIALSLQYQSARENKPYQGCTLSGIVSNVEDFVEGNFEEGGWEDWFTITSRPEMYTPYGQLLEAQSGLRAHLINTEGQELAKSGWGSGFLSGKICEMIEGPVGPKEKCTISKPGTTIANALNKNLGAGQDALITADEIDEIIAALVGQLANKAITGAAGLLGLSSGTGHTYSGFSGGSYLSAMDQQSNQAVSDSLGGSGGQFDEPILVQQDFNALANSYLPRLAAIAADASSSNQEVAAAAYSNAVDIISKTDVDEARITAFRDEYNALVTEANSAATTAARKAEIEARQTAIITEFTNLNAYTRDEMDSVKAAWDLIVA